MQHHTGFLKKHYVKDHSFIQSPCSMQWRQGGCLAWTMLERARRIPKPTLPPSLNTTSLQVMVKQRLRNGEQKWGMKYQLPRLSRHEEDSNTSCSSLSGTPFNIAALIEIRHPERTKSWHLGQSEELQQLIESDLLHLSHFLLDVWLYRLTDFLAPNWTDLLRINPKVYLRLQAECLSVDQQPKVHKISAFLLLHKKVK